MEPELSVVLFRRRGWTPEQYQAWSDRELAEGRSFVTSTSWAGETVLRFCIVNPLTNARRHPHRPRLARGLTARRGRRPSTRHERYAVAVDLVVRDARCVATMDGERRELRGGWVAVTDGFVSGVGTADPPPAATTIDATDCLVTPGLINAHHHLFQNLTRAYPPMTDKPLFGWLQSLYPLWRAIDTEAVHVSAWVGPRRARAVGVHDVDRPPLPPPARRRRSAVGRDRRGT